MYKLKNIFHHSFEKEEIYLHLFKSSWNKKIIDKSRQHDYRGFDKLIETQENWVVNTGNYTTANGYADELDAALTNILKTKVETNFVSILPEINVGEHWDYYNQDKCNTSIVWKVFGDTQVCQNGITETVSSNHAIILNTDYIHDAYNKSKQVHWLATSLVYNITYDEVIEIFSKESMAFL